MSDGLLRPWRFTADVPSFHQVKNMRLYSFVAGLYLSQLQRGLQTAHVLGELNSKYEDHGANLARMEKQQLLREWQRKHKTIIIASAMTAGEVRRLHEKLLTMTADWQPSPMQMPVAMFCEDVESADGMATAVGIVVPQHYYDAKFVSGKLDPAGLDSYVYTDEDGKEEYYVNYPYEDGMGIMKCVSQLQFEFVKLIKSYPLAQS